MIEAGARPGGTLRRVAARGKATLARVSAGNPPCALALTGVYLAVVLGLMLWRNISLTPDRLFLLFALAALALGRGRRFLWDWTPFLALLLGYEVLRGFAATFGQAVHGADVAALERAIFADVPTLALQRRLYQPGSVAWYDLLATGLYLFHFPFPLLLAFALWLKDRPRYHRYAASLLLLSYAGFITYVLFPVMPPWLAGERGILPPVAKVLDATLRVFSSGHDISPVYRSLTPNPVAAFPSLHSAYPLLGALVAVEAWGRRAGWLFVYPVLVWFSVVYLGEHYVLDVVGGAAYALAAFLAVQRRASLRLAPAALLARVATRRRGPRRAG